MADAPMSVEHRQLFHQRRKDRRRGIPELVGVVRRALSLRGDPALARCAVEETLGRLAGVQGVRIRDGSRRGLIIEEPGGESLTIDIPSGVGRPPGVLEARIAPGAVLGEWDRQLLSVGAQLAALVFDVERAATSASRSDGVRFERNRSTRRDGAAPLIGSTPPMAVLRSRIERVAATDFTILLEGESGVGKELVARQIHELSPRRDGPFVAINCAALVETLLEAELFGIEDRTATGVRGRRGKFEHADGGTLFLDEVSDLSLSAQAKLLRAIQDLAVERVGGERTRPVNIRIVAATNRALSGMVERGHFRADLFYRLGGVDLHVPSLRERRADIAELAQYFLERHRDTRRLRLSSAARLALITYDWPGNVRELERLIERIVALAKGDVIELDDLPPRVRGDYDVAVMPSIKAKETLRVWASRYCHLALDRCNGNKRRTARELGISYHTLITYLESIAVTSPVPQDANAERPAPVPLRRLAATTAAGRD